MVAILSGSAHATLVGSLHINNNQSTNGVVTLKGFTTRTANGNANTRGTVVGDFSFLAGGTLGNYGTQPPAIKTFSATTFIEHIDRYPGTTKKGIAVWDYDLSGISSNAWELKVDFSDRNTVDADEWYISFNGLGRTLDTTDVTTLTPGSGHAILADPTKYVKIGELPAGSDAVAVYSWDLTEIIQAAQSNGGLVRVVYAAAGFKDDIKFYNDSGIIGAVSTAGTPVVIPAITTLFEDDFSGESAVVGSGVVNGWTLTDGAENKDYNTNNTASAGSSEDATGMLVMQDALTKADELLAYPGGDGWERALHLFDGVALTNEGDWLNLSMDVGVFTGTWASATVKSAQELRIGLVEIWFIPRYRDDFFPCPKGV
jgi:hypothetical protein